MFVISTLGQRNKMHRWFVLARITNTWLVNLVFLFSVKPSVCNGRVGIIASPF